MQEIFRKQEAVFDETQARLNQSYFKNSISGFWNFSKVDTSNATIGSNVNYSTLKVGLTDLKIEDILTNIPSILRKLEKFEAKLDQISLNLKNITDLRKINLSSDVELTGNFLVAGNLHAKTITAGFVNNASISIANNIVNHASDTIIDGRTSFLPVNTNKLTVSSLNGVPLEDIVFDTSIKNYNIDFSKFNRLKINGHLNFSQINNVKWEDLMQSIVWKDESTIIPGETIMEGVRQYNYKES